MPAKSAPIGLRQCP